MSAHPLSAERARFLSVLGVFVLAGLLLAFLFHTPASVAVAVDAPPEANGLTSFDVRVVIPPGQRLPVAGQTVVLETAAIQPALLERATCWGDATCDGGLRHQLRPLGFFTELARADDGAAPSEGALWVRVEGYGRSEATGYGQEVEPQRSLAAPDLAGEDGVGVGYGDDDKETVLRYVVRVDASAIPPGTYHVTFLVETGSESMGAVSSPRATIRLGG